MKKMFKSKKKKKYLFLIYIIIISLTIIISNKMINYVDKDYLFSEKFSNLNIDLDKENILLKMGLNYKKRNTINQKVNSVFNELIYDNPKIYLYNTHNYENYDGGTVVDAAKLLKEKLEDKNIDVMLEDTDIVGEVKKNNLQYKDTYKVTRELILKNMSDDISLYIDLHRDSVAKSATTTTINEKDYAKILFVVGSKHESYKENYDVCDNLNKYLKNIDNKLSRGILERKSSSYNQDLAGNVILIELGSENNTIEEVSNTIEVLSDALSNYLNE